MITKKLRFHGHGSLRFLYKNADTLRSRLFTVRLISNPNRKQSRFSVVVSKKVHKSSVGRNRIRRRIYEILRHEHQDMHSTWDIAVIVTSGEVLAATHEELVEALRELFKQAGVYR